MNPVGVLCPSAFEAKALDRKALVRAGAIVEISGMGKVRAALGCHRLLKRAPKLRGILLIGFAGALTKGLQIGDVIEPSLFIEQDYNAEPFEKFPNMIRRKRKRFVEGSIAVTMLTQDRFVKDNPYAADPRGAKLGRLSCDMESYAVAKFASEEGVPYGVVKLISDNADHSADTDFLEACRKLRPKLNQTLLEAVRAFGR